MSIVFYAWILIIVLYNIDKQGQEETLIRNRNAKKKNPTIMVVLGCAMPDLQQDRIQRALEFAEKKTDDPMIWFVTGGVKNALGKNSVETEAAAMSKKININAAHIVLDEKARNTAENFANLKQWITDEYLEKQHATTDIPEVVITTSAFHQNRAAKIFDGIFQDFDTNIKLTWNVSDGACPTCWSDEIIHMRNVEADVLRALVK